MSLITKEEELEIKKKATEIAHSILSIEKGFNPYIHHKKKVEKNYCFSKIDTDNMNASEIEEKIKELDRESKQIETIFIEDEETNLTAELYDNRLWELEEEKWAKNPDMIEYIRASEEAKQKRLKEEQEAIKEEERLNNQENKVDKEEVKNNEGEANFNQNKAFLDLNNISLRPQFTLTEEEADQYVATGFSSYEGSPEDESELERLYEKLEQKLYYKYCIIETKRLSEILESLN